MVGPVCTSLCAAVCEWIAICTSAFHIPWEPVLSFQILVLLFSHKSRSESDPECMAAFMFSLRTILFKPLGAFDLFFFFPEGINH